MAPINNELQVNALIQCIEPNDDSSPPTPPPPLQPSDFRLMHMNKEQLCDIHEHNETTVVDNFRVKRTIDVCLASGNQESDIRDARDILEWAQEKVYKSIPTNRLSRDNIIVDAHKAITCALEENINCPFCTHYHTGSHDQYSNTDNS